MKRLVQASESTYSNMTIGEFLSEVKSIYNSYFPNSECYAASKRMMWIDYIDIRWFLSLDSSETSHNIRMNDMFHIAFDIMLTDETESGKVYDVEIRYNSKTNDSPMPSIITLDVEDKVYKIKPDNKYLVYESRNLPFRKTTGSPEKILSTLDKYAQKLHIMVSDDLANDNIHDSYLELVKAKL